MKKILLTLGSIAAIATPVAAVVSCGAIGEYGPSETRRAKYFFSNPTEEAIINAGVQALSIPKADIRSALGGIEYEFGLLKFHYYVRIVFKTNSNSSFDAGNGRVNVREQDSILIGLNESTDPGRTTTEMKVFYINNDGRATAEDLTPALIAKKKFAIFENAMKKAVEEIKPKEARQEEREESELVFDTVEVRKDASKPTTLEVLIMRLGYSILRAYPHLLRKEIESIVEENKTLSGIDKVTEIVCHRIISSLRGGVHKQEFIIRIPEGRATDVDYIMSIVETVAGTEIQQSPSDAPDKWQQWVDSILKKYNFH